MSTTSPKARLMRSGSVTITKSALTHCTWESRRWLLGPPATESCHGISSSSNSAIAPSRTSGSRLCVGVLDREADGVGALELAAARVVARLAGLLGQRRRALLPGHREPVVCGGVGVRLPGTLPGQRRSLVGVVVHASKCGRTLRHKLWICVKHRELHGPAWTPAAVAHIGPTGSRL